MATIVNDRDLMLSTASPRVTSSSAYALTTVPTVKVVPSTQSFTVDSSGTMTPSSLTFNSSVANVLDPVTYKWYPTGTSSSVVSTASSLTLANSEFLVDSVPLGYTFDPYPGSVSLILAGNGTNGSTSIIDSSRWLKSISIAGNTNISTAQSKYDGSSIYFDGNGDYLSINDTSGDLRPDTSDFTVEAWIYVTSADATNGKTIATNRTSGQSNGWHLAHNPISAGGCYITLTTWKTGQILDLNITSSIKVTVSSWTHVAVSKSGTVWTIYINGVSVGTGTETGAASYSATLLIGRDPNFAVTRDFTGYIDDFRITKGIARYTSTFDPSTVHYYNEPYYNSVLYLINGNGTNGSSTLTDSGLFGHTVTSNSTTLSTSIKKNGSASIQVSGSGSATTGAGSRGRYNASNSAIGEFCNLSTTYTVEFWTYCTSLSGNAGLLSAGNYVMWYYYSGPIWQITFIFRRVGADLYVYVDGNSNGNLQTILITNFFTLNTWTHVALVRTGNSAKVYKNGIEVGSISSMPTSVMQVGKDLLIGSWYYNIDGTNYYEDYIGYIDDVRITNNIARYTSNFDPETTLNADATHSTTTNFDGKSREYTFEVYGNGVLAGSDRCSVTKIVDGTRAVQVQIVNQAVTVPTTSGGVSTYTGLGAIIKVSEGGVPLLNDDSATPAAGTFKVLSLSATGISASSVVASGSGTSTITITDPTGMGGTSALATYTIRVTRVAGTVEDINVMQTFVKATDGATGSSGRVVSVTTTKAGWAYNSSGNLADAVTTATVTATAANTTGTVYYDFVKNGTSVQNTTSNSYVYTAPSTYSSMPQTLRVDIREGASTGTIVATDTLSMIGGQAGSKTVQVYISNPSQSLATTSGGTVDYTGSGTTIQVAEGATMLTEDSTVPYANGTFRITSASGTSITPNASPTGTGTLTITYGNHSNMTANNASITYTVSVTNSEGTVQTYTATQTFSKAIAGAPGSTGSTGATGTRGPLFATYVGAWNQTTAESTLATMAAGRNPTTPIKGDVVSYTGGAKEYDGSTWGAVASYINGSIIASGTIGADRLVAGSTISAGISIDSAGYIKASGVTSTSSITNGSVTGFFDNPTAASASVVPIGIQGSASNAGNSSNTYPVYGVVGVGVGTSSTGVYGIASLVGIRGFASTGGEFLGTNIGIKTSVVANAGYAIQSNGAINITTSFFGTALLIDTGNLTLSSGNIAVTGAITATGNITAYYSDDNLKTRIGPIENALDKLRTLDTFYYKANEIAQSLGYGDEVEVGVSAQQVQKVLPMIVPPAPIDSKYLTVRYERLAPLIIAGINELTERVEKLENDNS